MPNPPSRVLCLPGRLAIACVLSAAITGCSPRAPESSTDVAPGVDATPRAAAAADAPSRRAETDALREAARQAFSASRFVAPAGDNALEHFLALRDRAPDDAGAREALVELFPVALAAVQSAIDRGEPDEAERVLDLVDRASPGSIGASGLRIALARRSAGLPQSGGEPRETTPVTVPVPPDSVAIDRIDRQDAASGSAAARPAPVGGAPRRTGDLASRTTSTAIDRPGVATRERAPAGIVPAPEPAPAATPIRPPEAVAATSRATRRDPVLIQRIEPSYPESARQRRIQGWVDIEIDVGADGSVAAARVVDASPSAIFNSAALRAVSRWRFDPAQADGAPQPTTTRTRINFRLG